MPKVHPSPLPSNALLKRYKQNGEYTDCYTTTVPISITHEQFIFAFYTTALFKLERLLLSSAVSRASTDEEVVALAKGKAEKFAAWTVEERATNQLLLCDFRGKTRSWLMVEKGSETSAEGTRIFFGSAVVTGASKRHANKSHGIIFRLLLGFHKLYSVALLSRAAARLIKLN